MTFCSMINKLESFDVIRLPFERARTTTECLENLTIILNYLEIDLESIADRILRGQPKSIFCVVNIIYQNYGEVIRQLEMIKNS